ncbi:hypothetical protein [Methanoregula sp.]|jgi:hypothetical protein|uniref:hypothetical protein n=1 Tax=Methanoregula sp. TaxID=2052170 RepID=UPI003C22C60E
MNRKILGLFTGALILLVTLSAGCIAPQPGINTTEPVNITETVSPTILTTPLVSVPETTIITTANQTPTITVTPTATPEPVATLTTKPIPYPSMSSIYLYGVNAYVAPLAFDDKGTITKGNITISGLIDSLSSYPLQVVMRGEIISAHPPTMPPRATAYQTVNITPHGVAGFVLEMDEYVFNYRLDYGYVHESYNITVMNVSIAQ